MTTKNDILTLVQKMQENKPMPESMWFMMACQYCGFVQEKTLPKDGIKCVECKENIVEIDD